MGGKGVKGQGQWEDQGRSGGWHCGSRGRATPIPQRLKGDKGDKGSKGEKGQKVPYVRVPPVRATPPNYVFYGCPVNLYAV